MKMLKVSEMTIISAPVRKKLIDFGLHTLEDVAALHTSPRKCFELEHEMGIPVDKIRWIVSVTMFSQIRAIDAQQSMMLVKLGIDSLPKLARANAGKLLVDMRELNRLQAILPSLPSLELIDHWVASAQVALDGLDDVNSAG